MLNQQDISFMVNVDETKEFRKEISQITAVICR